MAELTSEIKHKFHCDHDFKYCERCDEVYCFNCEDVWERRKSIITYSEMKLA